METIAGVECTHYILFIEGGVDVDVCAASNMGSFIPGAPAGLNGGGGDAIPNLPQSAEVWLEEFGDGFFILSMEGGGASYRATAIEPGSPEDELFAPPPGYTPMQIPGF